MIAPFYQFGMFANDIALLLAVLIGIGFGFFLEQAGLGSSTKLVQQFYFRDMAVFKVMFSAIVTAMLGLFWLAYLEVVDLSLIYLPETFVVPQAVGGVLFGIGFVIGGYCPGTCVVATITGKIDGLVQLLGIPAGIFVFGELYPYAEGWLSLTAMGNITIPELFGLPEGILLLLVATAALAGFFAAERIEAGFRKRDGDST